MKPIWLGLWAKSPKVGSLLPWYKEYRLLNKAWFLQCTSVLCQPKIAEFTTIFWPCLILWSEKGCNVKYYYAKCAPPLEPLSILMKLHLQWISAKLSQVYLKQDTLELKNFIGCGFPWALLSCWLAWLGSVFLPDLKCWFLSWLLLYWWWWLYNCLTRFWHFSFC